MTQSVFTAEDAKKRWFVTGGAGFIGSHVVDLLVSAGCEVTVVDNLSLSSDKFIAGYAKSGQIAFVQEDLLDLDAVTKAMGGHDIVWHLAANTDIPSGYTKHRIDLDNDVIATCNVLEAMTKTGVKQMLFSSTGAVYGESIQGTFKEASGPLLPLSLYGAGKVAAEAFIAAYCSLFGIQAWIYRFGNVIGPRTSHGIIYDFIAKLKEDEKTLEVLGTGRGEKNYFLVEECIHGMLYTYHKSPTGPFPVLVNLGTDSTSKILEIAAIILEEMGLKNVEYTFTGTPRGWPGDQPVVLLDTAKIHEFGWYAKRTSNDAVRTATRRLLGIETFMLTVNTLQ
ncbi:MAG TPA: NAD-dependent epimerase/dehydratase family protein [Candidatus Limnocylindria bacterium]|nr:NAD-dependent epimerase/dehydratase family protein [Candidatus Limnocylindria bacterium]